MGGARHAFAPDVMHDAASAKHRTPVADTLELIWYEVGHTQVAEAAAARPPAQKAALATHRYVCRDPDDASTAAAPGL